MTIKAPNGDAFEYGRDMVDVTMNGLFGGTCDETRVFISGMKWYRINGVTVSFAEFSRRFIEQYPDANPLAQVAAK